MHNQYTFHYNSGFDENSASYPLQTTVSKAITVDEGQAWPTILREFTNFLSGIYGYNISEKVFMTEWDGSERSIQDYE